MAWRFPASKKPASGGLFEDLVGPDGRIIVTPHRARDGDGDGDGAGPDTDGDGDGAPGGLFDPHTLETGMDAPADDPALAALPSAARVAPEKAKPGFLDYLGLIGATLGEADGDKGSIDSFLGERKKRDMDHLLASMDLSPEEQALVAAGEGKSVLGQRVGDTREDKVYGRNRADTMADRTQSRGWDVADQDAARKFATTERQAGQDFTAGEGAKDRGSKLDEFNRTMKYNYWKTKQDNATDLEKAGITGAGKGIVNGMKPEQLASIYKDSMNYIDSQAAMQTNLDTIERETGQFVNEARGWNSQGQGLWNDIGQKFSMKTSDLDRHTKAIAPLMRPAGSGSSSDADTRTFAESTVNINNTPGANRQAALGAQLMAGRHRDYVQFLREHVDISDPSSLQTAQNMWAQYAQAVPVFDAKTKQPRDPKAIPSFDQWLQAAVAADHGAGGGGGGGGGTIPPDAVAHLKANPSLASAFDAKYGQGAAAQVLGR